MKKILAFLALVVFIISPVVGRADERGVARDYTQVSPNGKYVFVMLVPEKSQFAEKDKALRKKYRISGEYPNNGTFKPLWTVDWYSFKEEVYVSSDGKHLARLGLWSRLGSNANVEKNRSVLQQPAVAFYNEGKLLKQYTIENLIENAHKIPPSVSHFKWKKDVSFEDATGRLTLMTIENKKYVFDIYSGEILTS